MIPSMTSNVSLDDEPKKTTEVTKRSIPGIISFTLGAGLFVTIVVIVLFGSGSFSQGIKIVIGLLMMTSILASVTGLVFGIVGLIQKNRRRLFSVLGVILNGLFSFCTLPLQFLLLRIWDFRRVKQVVQRSAVALHQRCISAHCSRITGEAGTSEEGDTSEVEQEEADKEEDGGKPEFSGSP